MNDIKAALKKLVADDEIKEVLKKLLDLLLLTDNELHNEVVSLSARFKNNTSERHGGRRDIKDFNIEHSNIIASILIVIDKINTPDNEKELTFQQLIVKLYAEYKPKTG